MEEHKVLYGFIGDKLLEEYEKISSETGLTISQIFELDMKGYKVVKVERELFTLK